MNKSDNLVSILYFIAGGLFVLSSIFNMINGSIFLGIIYSSLAVVFISLGVFYLRKNKKT